MKQLFKILQPLISRWKMLKYILLGLLSGLLTFAFVNLVTRVIGLIIGGNYTDVSREFTLVFASVILLYIWSRRTLALSITRVAQRVFWSLRRQILSSVLNASYQQLSERKAKITTATLSDVHVLTDASMAIIQFTSSLILAISCLAYLLSISVILFSITLLIALLGIAVYLLSSGKNARQFQRSRGLENEFQENFWSILNGFKEIYMDPKKGKFIYENRMKPIAESSYMNNLSAFTGFINNQITGQVLFYILISSVLLLFSLVLKIKPEDTVSFVFTLLYLLGAIEAVMQLLPMMARAGVSARELTTLKKELEEIGFNNRIAGKHIGKNEFDRISIDSLEYRYGVKEDSFRIGPMDFDIRKGEVIFIYGGNGSGKTTFVQSIIGLYPLSAGRIRLNGVPVDDSNYPEYRAVFSVVFSDFYLFNEILGIETVDLEKWNYYLDLFEIDDKVRLEGKRLSTTELSTGQRKRLALIVSLLENKPILVIDEWAADQDPHFRRKFYTEIIPKLKKEGFTIIAITHDDRFYDCADKLYKMEYGKLTPESTEIYSTQSTII